MTKPGRGRGILVSHKPTRTRTLNEYYRLARLARSTAWQRVYGEPGKPQEAHHEE